MPRVSESHLAARRRQILDAARTCFLRNGFHATSMQDVIAEAGLSVGAVYRYFPGKAAIIAAIAEEAIGSAAVRLGDLAHADPAPTPAEAVVLAVDAVEPELGPDGALRIAIQVWSEAMRDADLAALAGRVFGVMRGHFAAVARRAAEAGTLAPGADPEAVGAVLFALLPGYALQRVLTGYPDRDTYLAAVRTLLA
jgi:AcrR family transcriptional regulator